MLSEETRERMLKRNAVLSANIAKSLERRVRDGVLISIGDNQYVHTGETFRMRGKGCNSRKIPEDKECCIVSAYHWGCSSRFLAKKNGLTHQAILNIVKRNNGSVRRQGTGGKRGKGKKFLDSSGGVCYYVGKSNKKGEVMKTVFFTKDEIQEMAVFLAELTRQSIAWKCKEQIAGWLIELTGF